jgi:hypothetical protein
MTAALRDCEFQPLLALQGIPKLTATLGSSGAVWNSIHFIKIEVYGISAFESLRTLKSKCLP